MTKELPRLLRRSSTSAATSAALDEFVIYECQNPVTDCEHQYLATNGDHSFLISFGEYLLGFDFELPADTQRWLTQDYAASQEKFTLQLVTLRDLIHRTYVGGALFGFVKYHEDMAIDTFELSLRDQETADCGPEYVIQKNGDYQRWFRQQDLHVDVSVAERELLDICCPAFVMLGKRFRELLISPPTPRYRDSSAPVAVAP